MLRNIRILIREIALYLAIKVHHVILLSSIQRNLPAPKHALLSIILRDVLIVLPIIADIVMRKAKRTELLLKLRAIVANI